LKAGTETARNIVSAPYGATRPRFSALTLASVGAVV